MWSVSDVFDLVLDKSSGNCNEFLWHTQTGCRKLYKKIDMLFIPDFKMV